MNYDFVHRIIPRLNTTVNNLLSIKCIKGLFYSIESVRRQCGLIIQDAVKHVSTFKLSSYTQRIFNLIETRTNDAFLVI